jgi:hypothetical protein
LAARLLERHVFDCTVGAISGIVDEDIDVIGLRQDLLDSGGRGFVVGDVHGERLDAPLSERLHAIGAASNPVDKESSLMQAEGGGLPDARGCPGDERHLLLRCGGHGVVLAIR